MAKSIVLSVLKSYVNEHGNSSKVGLVEYIKSKEIDIAELQKEAESKLDESRSRFLNPEQAKQEAAEYDLDVQSYQKILNIFSNTKLGIVKYQVTEEDEEPHTVDDSGRLESNIVSTYKKGVKPLEKLIADRNVKTIAERFHIYARHMTAEQILSLNPATIIDYKENGDPIVKKTTFIHALFEAKQPIEIINKCFAILNNSAFYNRELLQSYLDLSAMVGGDNREISIKDLIIEKSQTPEYNNLYEISKSRWKALFPRERNADPQAAIAVDTHTESVHATVDQSLVRLAQEYYKDNISQISSPRNLAIRRNSKWQQSINKEIAEFEKQLKTILANDKSLEDFIKPTLAVGDNLANEKQKFKFYAEAALRMIEGLKQDRYGKSFNIESNKEVSCGLTPKEVVAICHRSLRDHEGEENPRRNWRNDRATLQFMHLVEGLYDAKRGYNLDNSPEEWKDPKTAEKEDHNRCTGGLVNAVVGGLKDHKLVEVKVINLETMEPILLKTLPDVLMKLSQEREKGAENIKLMQNWFNTRIVSDDLANKIKHGLLHNPGFMEGFSDSDVARFTGPILNGIGNKALGKLLEEVKVDLPESSIEDINLNLFVFDEGNPETSRDSQGYITIIESKYLENPENHTEFKTNLNRLVASCFVEDHEDSYNARKAGILMELLLNSTDEEVVAVTTEILQAHLRSLPQQSKDRFLLHATERKHVGLFNSLIEAGSDINTHDYRPGHNNQSLIHIVAKNGNLKLFNFILQKSPGQVKLQDQDSTTALHCALTSKNHDIAKILVEKMTTTELDLQDINENTALHYALMSYPPNTDVARILVEKMTPTSVILPNKRGATALHYAVSSNIPTDIAKALIKKMSYQEIGLPDKEGKTALHHIARNGNLDTAKLLIENMTPAQIAMQDAKGRTALYRALKEKKPDIARALITKMDAKDFALQTPYGDTALHLAAQNGYTDIAKALIEKMTSEQVALQTLDKHTALHEAVIIRADIGRTDIAKALIEKMTPAQVALQDRIGRTALHEAVIKQDLDIIELLIEKMTPKQIALKGIENKTALGFAWRNKEIREIIQCKVNPMQKLFEAIEKRDLEVVELAIKYGANVNGANYLSGFTPLMELASSSTTENEEATLEIAKLLLDNGAKVRHMSHLEQDVFNYVEPGSKLEEMLEKQRIVEEKQMQFDQQFRHQLSQISKETDFTTAVKQMKHTFAEIDSDTLEQELRTSHKRQKEQSFTERLLKRVYNPEDDSPSLSHLTKKNKGNGIA